MNLPLRAYWHLWLVNHWREVVAEQLTALLTGGAFQAAESIYLTVCGEPEHRSELRSLLGEKFEFAHESNDPWRYEFPAIERIHADACKRERFVALYCHAKGVSYPDDRRGRWRRMLNTKVVHGWRSHCTAILGGCDVSGQNYLIGDGPYYSGNFWLADSRYLKTLKRPKALDQSDRFQAEQWLCSAPHTPNVLPFIECNE